jgi:hypothetical protein
MYPLLRPGSLVMVDEKRKFATGGWTSEFDRPIYLLEHREGFLCGWCALAGNRLIVQAHPSSQLSPRLFVYPDEIELVGQIVGVAMLLAGSHRPNRSPSKPAASPGP